MTLNGFYCNYLIRRHRAADSLRDKISEELISILLREDDKHRGKKITFDDVYCGDRNLYDGLGASDVLRDRHGSSFVLNVLGLREPVTLKEKLQRFFTGKYPKIQPLDGVARDIKTMKFDEFLDKYRL